MAGGPLRATPKENRTLDEKTAIEPVADSQDGDTISFDKDGNQIPTEEEKRTLRHRPERLPKAAFLVAVVELCERFTYYGASGIFQNYVKKPLDGSEGRGALGMGHQGATGLTVFFQFWCYGIYNSQAVFA